MLLPNKLLEKRYAVQVELWSMQHKITEIERDTLKMQERVKELAYRIKQGHRGTSHRTGLPKVVHEEHDGLIYSISTNHHIIRKLRKAIEHKRKEWGDIETELRRIYGAVGATASVPSDVEFLEKITMNSENTNPAKQFRYDAFISHASEDKESVARPLFRFLSELGVKVWFDEIQLAIGDSLRKSIDGGLTQSKFGIVIISPHFLAKNWTQYELDSLVAREMETHKIILPIWHKISKNEVLSYSPKLADKLALHTSIATLEEIALSIALVITNPKSDSSGHRA